ncbi:unnamed protein product [Vitrella brassicaformis CCMP3155]|uniref:Uncharacterized protein n=1 Tax=Vitrella brassicaformis (strain CCMP3155) TaxID=1169540 RepID=A0A0G4GFK8_VITBC|nr:unnamed protein product [Vitrella brassicaformis CCMP3155]|eukprot:CEM28313.1 unnamed protein product [Vitrella brassicaformis CCMP3155]
MASSSSSGRNTHPQAAVGASPCRYRVGSRVLMVSERRRDDKFQWVEAEVYKLEPTAGGTRVFMREVGGTEEFKRVVPNATRHFHKLDDIQAGCDGFKWVGREIVQQQGLDGQKSGEPFCLFKAIVDSLGLCEVAALSEDFTDLLGVAGCAALFGACKTLDFATNITTSIQERIDQLLREQQIDSVLTYDHNTTQQQQQPQGGAGQQQMTQRGFLESLWWVLAKGGQWAGNKPILPLARSSGCLASLPLIITAADVRQATADKTVFLNRPEAIRQYSLYAHRLGDSMQLTRTAGGRDTVGGGVVRVHTDAADPPCRPCTFRGRIIENLASLSSRVVSCNYWRPTALTWSPVLWYRSYSRYSAGYDSIGALMAQEPPLWGCRTIDYTNYDTSSRLVILCGDEEGDEFTAYIEMTKYPDESASIALWTTEAPQQGVTGPTAFPQTVAIAQNKMDRPCLELLSAI